MERSTPAWRSVADQALSLIGGRLCCVTRCDRCDSGRNIVRGKPQTRPRRPLTTTTSSKPPLLAAGIPLQDIGTGLEERRHQIEPT